MRYATTLCALLTLLVSVGGLSGLAYSDESRLNSATECDFLVVLKQGRGVGLRFEGVVPREPQELYAPACGVCDFSVSPSGRVFWVLDPLKAPRASRSDRRILETPAFAVQYIGAPAQAKMDPVWTQSALSPDGAKVAYVVVVADRKRHLVVEDLATGQCRPIIILPTIRTSG